VRDVDAARGIPAVLVEEVILVVDEEKRRAPGGEVPPDGREGIGAGSVGGDRRDQLRAD
jgi:hypothetical protein